MGYKWPAPLETNKGALEPRATLSEALCLGTIGVAP